MLGIRPFWRYYGGKWRAAPRYPAPLYDTIIEPFAGSAGYSLRYPDRKILLIEKYPVIAEMWRYLIAVKESELLSIPEVESVNGLPPWVPLGARYLVGFCLGDASATPRKTLSAGMRWMQTRGQTNGWTEQRKLNIAENLSRIRHWAVIEGDYSDAPDIPATWFIDPPYCGPPGRHYKHADVDYSRLGGWCETRPGQVIVCENAGATWLPFRHFAMLKAGLNGKGSAEVIWTSGDLMGAMRRNADAQAALQTVLRAA
ncbi:hypothetical protein UFOVP786_75 [uncultured Caudovirales phage]|uniref:D12 class N6 adenine-specific DNA methyltransferase n=1 Tax=uncultured Caudovirales phage TaxID=2100421 RepID=A0A6J5NZP8_9CAUD|nr:hypothetical protein UFOVP786_75 [uncultured Caudovirales phage]